MKVTLKVFLLVMSLSLVGVASSKQLCQGFLPENNMRIPVNHIQGLVDTGINQDSFNHVMDTVEKYYAPVVAAKGGKLVIERLWTDETVNASATREGSNYVIHMYGGLARFNTMTEDGMLLVACHETGHHLGGAPKISSWFGLNDWASNEGEADYFATLRCMRFTMMPTENATYVSTHQIDPVLRSSCEATYDNVDNRNLCMREGMASMTVSAVFQALKKETSGPHFETPDTSQVSTTDDAHPATQCRLDTYYQGALCVHNAQTELSDSDYRVGTCVDTAKMGVRPRCWFQPNTQVLAPSLAQAN